MAKDPQERFQDILFPLQGIDQSMAFGQQPSGTTPTGNNVRGYEPLTQRARGGSRPGLSQYIASAVDGTHLIQELNIVNYAGSSGQGSGGTSIGDQMFILFNVQGIATGFYLVSVYLNGFPVGPTQTVNIDSSNLWNASQLSITVPGQAYPNPTYQNVGVATTALTALNTPLPNIYPTQSGGNALLGPSGSATNVITVPLADVNIPGNNTVTWEYVGRGSYVDKGRLRDNFTATITWTRYSWNGNAWVGGTNGTVVQTGIGGWQKLDFNFQVT